ncbi:uncharacterized protein EV420DRAFT_1478212 [Desarmillaria tabescens]|uniref:Uncharacterized protein n=1 Tax=Armillaria tabescens TaxID=1929756 RepID=A0AA39N7G0_ARMTA|nr:uncharacterized protein EV420DRAFT_1478212 [Desarmillaria tabescens]KAK0460426.1 hypothetical protein EV420DRAFT_1478212 [Desarmillaria tabescens]
MDRDHEATEGGTSTGRKKSQPEPVSSMAEGDAAIDSNGGRDEHNLHTLNIGPLDDDETWVRSTHYRDPEGLYLQASQLQGRDFIIWPEEYDAENDSTREFL